jgi:hypothetical protein
MDWTSILPPNRLVLGDLLAAILILIVLCTAAAFIKNDRQDVYLNLSFIVFGISVGWLVGIFIAPYTGAERTRFSEYAGAISTFISGYLVGKIDRLITHAFDPAVFTTMPRVYVFRISSFVVASITTMIIIYVLRNYGLTPISQ